MEADTIEQEEIKRKKIKKKYIRRTRKLLVTKLGGTNLFKGIGTWAVHLVRYSGPFLKWIREELKQMVQRTRKLLTVHKALYPRDDEYSIQGLMTSGISYFDVIMQNNTLLSYGESMWMG